MDLLGLPNWFWELIDSTKPNLKLLRNRLEELDQETLENFYGLYMTALYDLCDPWNGPHIDEQIAHLSEDSTKDLSEWIISQGYDFWSSIALKNGEEKEEALREAFRMQYAADKHPQLVKWVYEPGQPTGSSPLTLPITISSEKYGIDLIDLEEEIYKRVERLLL